MIDRLLALITAAAFGIAWAGACWLLPGFFFAELPNIFALLAQSVGLAPYELLHLIGGGSFLIGLSLATFRAIHQDSVKNFQQAARSNWWLQRWGDRLEAVWLVAALFVLPQLAVDSLKAALAGSAA
ncbi:MAG: hypothetical protein HY303_05385 [Candidatus Wallbacteria bacterium]|nr:hypothetical protein [Candidatus Wallbacteria bacterium]